jgi:hypothetical protein
MSRMRKAARGLSRLGVAFDVVSPARSSARGRRPKSSPAACAPRPSLVNIDSLAPAPATPRWSPTWKSTRASRASRWSATSRTSASSPRA